MSQAPYTLPVYWLLAVLVLILWNLFSCTMIMIEGNFESLAIEHHQATTTEKMIEKEKD